MIEPEHITGREGYLFLVAIRKAILHLQSVPSNHEPEARQSLIADLQRMLDAQDGRGDELMAFAFYRAITYQQALPSARRSRSDLQDMKEILLRRFPEQAKWLLCNDVCPTDLFDEKNDTLDRGRAN